MLTGESHVFGGSSVVYRGSPRTSGTDRKLPEKLP